MNIEIILVGLLIISTFTGLFTEALKKYLSDFGAKYKPNVLAGGAALFVAGMVEASYIIMTSTAVTAQVVVTGVILAVLSWLAAMVGYDKVVQTIAQIAGREK